MGRCQRFGRTIHRCIGGACLRSEPREGRRWDSAVLRSPESIDHQLSGQN